LTASQKASAKAAVEAGIVGDHQGGGSDELRHLRRVDAVAGDHLVGQAG
jgi:hypothetical protein